MLLRAKGYTVLGASNRVEALKIALRERVHVAVLDVRMETDADYDDTSGLTLAKQLDPFIVKIIVSAYLSLPIVRNSYDEELAFTLVGKDELPYGLLNALNQAFAKEVGLNFELTIHWKGIHLEQVARNIAPENKPDLPSEIEEILCKLFHRADEIAVSPLIPPERADSAPQSGAVVLKVQPHYQDGGWAAPVVVKLASREMIETEHRNYQRHVERYIDGFRRTSIQDLRQTHRLGGIVYSLVGAPLDECMDLGAFYLTCPTKEVITALTNLFTRTCQLWYKNREPNQSCDLIDLYAKPLKLSVHRLETALRQIDLAEWAGSANPLIPELKRQVVNPVEWFRRQLTLTSNVALCHIHGDLHSRNVLIDQNNQTWLIDFYRSGPGHIFRDLTELESDIKFVLLTNSDLSTLYQLELALLNAKYFDDTPTLPHFKQADLRKAFEVIQSLRRIAGRLTNSHNSMLDYYQGLLLQTLTMIYRQHVSAPKKRHAYLSASLLCERLDSW
ncbi:MAG: phosphotransferase [Anaerolineae bacterium]